MLYIKIEGGLTLRNFICQIYFFSCDFKLEFYCIIYTEHGNFAVASPGVIDHGRISILHINTTSIAYYMS